MLFGLLPSRRANPVTRSIRDEKSGGHRIAACLEDLIATSGGGTWPPRATFADSWPFSLRIYHHIAHDIAPLIPVEEASLDDSRNRQIIDALRLRLRSDLQTKVYLEDVRAALDSLDVTQAAWMGFFACIVFLRHAYRWGIIPVVREAQNESMVNLPEQLEVPFAALQRWFGTTAPCGNLSANVYYNFNDHREIEYSATVGLSSVHRTTERESGLLFVHMEEKALPMYRLMGEAATNLDEGDTSGVLRALQSAGEILKIVLKHFYDNLTDEKISHQFWLAYVQGFHAWALGNVNGVSGGHAMVIRSLDGFLGIRPWPTSEIEALHLPLAQRNWLNSLRDYDIRSQAKSEPKVIEALDSLVRQLRLWRMGHMRRMRLYQGVYRPERRKMTAGKSIVAEDVAPDESAMLEHLTQQLKARLLETK